MTRAGQVWLGAAVVVIVTGLVGCASIRSQKSQQASDSQEPPGGTYADLGPEQRRLINDMYDRYNALGGRQLDSETDYDRRVPVATRTTYEAATHALLRSELTNDSGKSLGTAFDLIERLDGVHGRVEGERGDLQFRIYAELVPDAIDRLKRSREFQRKRDNGWYHKGYPLNYRQEGGVPSIQISVSRSGRHADIDVDYRSSSFPGALFNGHLTAANSDVRAGDNHKRHQNRWAGFTEWWSGLFAVLGGSRTSWSQEEDSLEIPDVPRAGGGKVHEAADDFLVAWLIEGAPNESVAYVSRGAYACYVKSGDDPRTLDRGMVPYRILNAMESALGFGGPRPNLDGVAVPLTSNRGELKLVQHPHRRHFTLYQLPDDLAFHLDCERRFGLAPAEAPPKRKYGSHYLTLGRVVLPSRPDADLALLWKKHPKHWRIVSFFGPGVIEGDGLPDLHAEREVSIEYGTAEPSLIAATRDFHEAWLLERDVDRSIAAFWPRAYACINRVLNEDEPRIEGSDEQRRRLREGMVRTAKRMASAKRLADVINAQPPTHPDVRMVRHDLDEAYTLVTVPDDLAESFFCDGHGAVASASAGDGTHYYGTGFILKVPGGSEAALGMLWGREDGGWRILAFDVETP